MPTKKKLTLKKKTSLTEKDLQRKCERYLRTNKIRYFRIPSIVYQTLFGPRTLLSPSYRKQVAEFFKGFADLLLLFPSHKRYQLIELKIPGGKLSKDQIKEQAIHGEAYSVAWDYEEFVAAVDVILEEINDEAYNKDS